MMRTHGMSRTPTYRSWASMHSRCKNPSLDAYKNYGGRGISVCQRWGSFENFLADIGERPHGMELDRIDPDGNYEPNNCRWVTPAENNRNMRRSRKITFQGETLTLAEWERRLGLSRGSLWHRINDGLTPEEALATPRRYNKCLISISEIRQRLANGEKQRDIAADFGITQSFVSNIKSGRAYGDV